MFEYLLSLLRNIKNVLVKVLSVVYDFIPDSMKSRFTELSSKGAFMGMFFFVLGIFKNIYFLIAIPALVVTYRLFKVLKEKGIIDRFETIVNDTIDSVLHISTDCFPLILNFSELMSCVSHA